MVASKQVTRLPSDPKLAFCYDVLNKVSRRSVYQPVFAEVRAKLCLSVELDTHMHCSTWSCSFAVVIQQLPNPLRDAVCVFYLVLRGLDTVEDDMGIPIPEKLAILKSFHEKIHVR